jgi:hypothetical protein
MDNYIELTPSGVLTLSPNIYYAFQDKLESGEVIALYVFGEIDMIKLKFDHVDLWKNEKIVLPVGFGM